MKHNYTLYDNTVHLWRLQLSDFSQDINTLYKLLSDSEKERANRLHQNSHRAKFIITRALLRKTLATYTTIDAVHIHFEYGPLGKPFLPSSEIDFNISHSHDLAIFAFAKNKNIGVDIQKLTTDFKDTVAKRTFTMSEYEALMQIDLSHRIKDFYQLWTRKEAFVKALGQGLFTSARQISLSLNTDVQSIILNPKEIYEIRNIVTDPGYQAALAAEKPIEHVVEYQLSAI